MTEGAAYDVLQAWLRRIDREASILSPGRPLLTSIIRDHQDAPRPVGPHAMITLLATEDLGEFHCEEYRAIEIEDEERVALKVTRAIEWTFRVDAFASDAISIVNLFRSAARANATQLDLRPLVVRSVGDVTRAPDLTQQNWEGRARFDLALAGFVADEVLIDVIESGTISTLGLGGADVLSSLDYQRA